MRVLMVEDTQDDVELIQRVLRRADAEVHIQVVDDEARYLRALDAHDWDIILCDHNLPGFDSLHALRLLQGRGQDIPFIIVSGAIGEEVAVAAMKAGASDYVMKSNLARLLPAIEREIREAEVRRQKRKAEEALRLSEQRLAGIIGSAMDAVITTGDDQRIVMFNAAAEAMFGYAGAEVLGEHIELLIPEEYLNRIRLAEQGGSDGYVMGTLVSLKARHRNRRIFPIEATVSKADVSGERLFTVIVRDVSERVEAQERMAASLREKEVLLREIQHRVKNNLQVISSLLSLHANRAQHPAAAEALQESHSRVRAMAVVHEKLYAFGDLSRVDFGQYLEEFLPELARLYVRDPEKVTVTAQTDPISLDVSVAIPLALITNELVTNALKHAFPQNRRGRVVVKLQAPAGPQGKPRLTVQDDGVGLAVTPDLGEGSLGLKLVHSLARQIGCAVKWTSDHGTLATVFEPDPGMAQAEDAAPPISAAIS